MGTVRISMRRLTAVVLPAAVAAAVLVAPSARAETIYTLAQVATHNSAGNCWSAINGGVYNLTTWIPAHPGGASVIRALCGLDGSASYNSQHGGSRREAGEESPSAALARYRIGALDQTAPPPPTTTYSMTQVAAHNTSGDCWSAVSGGVYNLTSWVPAHPGGTGVIIAMCGKDGTGSFVGKHSGSSTAKAALAQFQIGVLDSSSPPPPAPTTQYTMAQVAAHSVSGDCWSAVSGGVYNLTAWIPAHPGGTSVIIAMCGKDGTGSFVGKHSGSPTAIAALAQYKIGVLGSSTPTPTANGSYTMAQVAAHNTAGDCWSAINGGVYDLTAWIPQHPGGTSTITALCGIDGSASFVGKHSGSPTANAALALYRIGTLIASAVAQDGSYTMAQVAAHNTSGDCWSAINGTVYNLTGWIPQHPGGQSMIIAMCGTDGTASYVGKHSGSATAGAALALYKIGTLIASPVAPVGVFTMAQVAAHSTAGDCWSVVSGTVYNLTAWIPQHPGGQAVIIAMCGTDGTAAYLGKHSGQPKALAALALYKVGTLAPGSETPLTTATPTVAPSARMFTLAQVRRHHTAAHCWTTLAKNVYDLSPVLKRHPRATSVRVLCGRSVTKAFIKKHGGVAKTARDLKRWRIGGLGVASTPPTTPTVTYTLANVATHATDASCWSVVSSNVYDLTQWIAQHPGGKAPITAMCGKDGTASFLSVHKGQAGPATALARFKIGALA